MSVKVGDSCPRSGARDSGARERKCICAVGMLHAQNATSGLWEPALANKNVIRNRIVFARSVVIFLTDRPAGRRPIPRHPAARSEAYVRQHLEPQALRRAGVLFCGSAETYSRPELLRVAVAIWTDQSRTSMVVSRAEFAVRTETGCGSRRVVFEWCSPPPLCRSPKQGAAPQRGDYATASGAAGRPRAASPSTAVIGRGAQRPPALPDA